jgi:transcriptional regulator with GAF, ATPase, and Fis domain
MVDADLSSFHGIIGRSAAMQRLFRRIERVAPIDVPVLILGESGTGKELVARAIQRISARRERRFEVVNCGALPRELLPSELFGHERGAFTSAIVRKVGLLAVANAGTLLLDEIGELPPEAQAMLLRFLQEGEVRPVGSTETARVNVRLIAATHRDLEAMKAQGSFREDLYYRLRRVVLEVPPLRARREDIPLLVEHILRVVNRRYGLAVEGIDRPARSVDQAEVGGGGLRDWCCARGAERRLRAIRAPDLQRLALQRPERDLVVSDSEPTCGHQHRAHERDDDREQDRPVQPE